MNPAREKATKLAVSLLSKFAGKTDSVKDVERALGELSDKDFDAYMNDLRSGHEALTYTVPNLGKTRLSTGKNLEIAKELKHEFFQRIWLTDAATGETYLTPERYLVMDLPIKRLQQHLMKKISIPEETQAIDERSGQVAKSAKGSGVSFPEFQILYSQGLEDVIRELFKFRGGDEKAYNEMRNELIRTGEVSMDVVDPGGTRAKAVDILSILLKSAHINNNL